MELSLDSNLVFVPKTISDFLSQLSSTVKDGAQRSSQLDGYVKRLEDEIRKIEVFKRELPLCMLILKDAIERLKEEVMRCGEMEDRPVIIEELFKPTKKKDENGGVVSEKENKDMKSWMSSAQLWSTSINFDFSKSQLKPRNEEDDRSVPENPIEVINKRNRGGAFLPFKGNCVKEDNYKEVSQVPSLTLMTPMMSEVGVSNSTDSKSSSGGGGSGPSFVKLQIEPQQRSRQQCHRKQRRCWSSELHRRFVDALQQLGGSQVATPKQIRELMQVDGLTNDEVKSHLQKYRLHVRKVPASSAAEGNGSWMNQDNSGDHSNENTAQSGSPQGPLLGKQFAKGGQFTTGGDSTETEEDDQNSDGHSWKGSRHNSGGDV